MAPKKVTEDDDWEQLLDPSADSRLPATHRIIFVINALMLTAIPVYLYASIFDLNVDENAPVYGAASVVTAVLLVLACQTRSKNVRNRLFKSRNVELPSTSALKQTQNKPKDKKSLDQETKRNEVDQEALALSLSFTNAVFLFTVVIITFFVLRSSAPQVNYGVSTAGSGIFVFYLATRS